MGSFVFENSCVYLAVSSGRHHHMPATHRLVPALRERVDGARVLPRLLELQRVRLPLMMKTWFGQRLIQGHLIVEMPDDRQQHLSNDAGTAGRTHGERVLALDRL